jgi:hypothetical protein
MAVSVHHAWHGDSPIALNGSVERPGWRPFNGPDISERVASDNNRTVFDHVVLLVHRDKESITNQSFHGAPRKSGIYVEAEKQSCENQV